MVLEAGIINCGGPQESLFRPLLFLLYINDTPQTPPNSQIHLHPDDISVFYRQKDYTEIENDLKVHLCRFENPYMFVFVLKNNALKILHS